MSNSRFVLFESKYSTADQLSAIVQIHPEKGADSIMPFADRYTRARFLMAHLGGEAHIRGVRNAKHGSVSVDPAGMASLKNRIIEYAVSQIGPEKENILLNNAKELFGLWFQGNIGWRSINEKKNINRV